MNEKQNYLNALKKMKTEFIPVAGEQILYAGFEGNSMEKGPRGGGYDGFGVLWAAPESGGGTVIPAPGKFLLSSENVEEWRARIKIPDPAEYDWAAEAELELAGVDRAVTAVNYGDGNGPFERLAAFMGFEEALISMALEPEAAAELLEAVTDYKIACLPYIKKYYNPDTYTLYDDVATQASTFMSPETYRELIKPCHKRIADRVKELEIIPILHCCGHAELLAEDFIEEGFAAWTSVQPCNDIRALLEKYGDSFCIIGGYDTNGFPGTTDDPESVRAEIERCFQEYGGCPGYIFSGFVMLLPDRADGEFDIWAPCAMLNRLAVSYSREHS